MPTSSQQTHQSSSGKVSYRTYAQGHHEQKIPDKERKTRLKKFQSQADALSHEFFQFLDSDNAQIEK